MLLKFREFYLKKKQHTCRDLPTLKRNNSVALQNMQETAKTQQCAFYQVLISFLKFSVESMMFLLVPILYLCKQTDWHSAVYIAKFDIALMKYSPLTLTKSKITIFSAAFKQKH